MTISTIWCARVLAGILLVSTWHSLTETALRHHMAAPSAHRALRIRKVSWRTLGKTSRVALARVTTLYDQAVVLRGMAPRRSEVIDVDPTRVAGSFSRDVLERVRAATGHLEGVVVDGDWDLEVAYYTFTNRLPYEACHLRWVEGRAWEHTPLFQQYAAWLQDGVPCRFSDYGALVARYQRLDEIFDRVRREGRMSENPEDLVRMSVVRDGRLLWGPNGRHRLAIAMIAGLKTMPARVGYVHRQALGHFQTLRRSSVSNRGEIETATDSRSRPGDHSGGRATEATEHAKG